MVFFPVNIVPREFKIGQENDRIVVSPIDPDPKNSGPVKEKYAKLVPDLRMLLIVYRMQRMLQDLLSKQGDVVTQADMASHFTKFQSSLEELKKADCSSSTDFAKQLSSAWHEIIDFYTTFQLSRLAVDERSKIQTFLHEINSYPSEERSLGFYLKEYTGENWLPFPFIEILKKLHEAHFLHPESSYLTLWGKLIDEITRG